MKEKYVIFPEKEFLVLEDKILDLHKVIYHIFEAYIYPQPDTELKNYEADSPIYWEDIF